MQCMSKFLDTKSAVNIKIALLHMYDGGMQSALVLGRCGEGCIHTPGHIKIATMQVHRAGMQSALVLSSVIGGCMNTPVGSNS